MFFLQSPAGPTHCKAQPASPLATQLNPLQVAAPTRPPLPTCHLPSAIIHWSNGASRGRLHLSLANKLPAQPTGLEKKKRQSRLVFFFLPHKSHGSPIPPGCSPPAAFIHPRLDQLLRKKKAPAVLFRVLLQLAPCSFWPAPSCKCGEPGPGLQAGFSPSPLPPCFLPQRATDLHTSQLINRHER